MTVAGSLSGPETDGHDLYQMTDNGASMVRRRRFLLGLAAAGTVAGCTDASNESTAAPDTGDASPTTGTGTNTPSPTPSGDDLVAENGRYTVDVAAVSDGSVSVSDTEISFTAPVEMTWALRGIHDGVPVNGGGESGGSSSPTPTPSGPPLEVGPTLDPTDGAQHAFATPVYDEAADRFELWFYVDETYRNAHDSHYIVRGGGRQMDLDSREASFTERAEGVYRATVTYDEPVIGDMEFPFGSLLDRPFSEVTPVRGRPEYTAVGVSPQTTGTVAETPQISFAFEYDASAETVTVTHQAGDTADGSNLTVLVDGEPANATFEGETAAGDSVTVDASGLESGSQVRVVWGSGDRSATLGLFTLP
jgi:hypothetical protein